MKPDDASTQALLRLLDRKGFSDDPRRCQSETLPLAERWLRHYGSIGTADPLALVGPLASLLTDVRMFGRSEAEPPFSKSPYDQETDR